MVFTAIITLICFNMKNIKIQEDMKILPQFTDILMMSSVLYASVVAVTVNLFYQFELQKILKLIQITERKLDIYTAHKRNKRYTLIILSGMGIYWILHFAYYNFYVEGANKISDFSFWICSYVPFILNNIYTLQFVAFCLILGALYQKFNNLLSQILSKNPQNYNNDFSQRLEEIQLFHNKLYKLVTAINDVHSLPMLVILAANFVFIFACSYFCLFGYMYKNRYVKPHNISDYLIPLIPAIPIFLQFISIILASEFVSKHRMETIKTIHSLCNIKSLSNWVR